MNFVVPNTVKRVLHAIREECKSLKIDLTDETEIEVVTKNQGNLKLGRQMSVIEAPEHMHDFERPPKSSTQDDFGLFDPFKRLQQVDQPEIGRRSTMDITTRNHDYVIANHSVISCKNVSR